jgi:hypothetical protein
MKAWQFSGFAGALGTMTLAAIGQHAAMRPHVAPPSAFVEAAFGAAPPATAPDMAETDFGRALLASGRAVVPPNTTVIAESYPAPSAPTDAPQLSTRPARFIIDTEFHAAAPDGVASADATGSLPPNRVTLAYAAPSDGLPQIQPASLRPQPLAAPSPPAAPSPSATPGATAAAASHDSYFRYYPFSEVPLGRKPAEIVLDQLKDVPIGTPLEEIKRVADAFGLDFNFLKTVAKIESDFNPRDRTGSYIGLFQLSRAEFRRWGAGGDITNPRDNAVAAAAKFVSEAAMFEMMTNRAPTFSDLYLIHQQGWEGAAEHVNHPDRLAWKSMCATDEGMAKGERWCKHAIWWNTLPAVKREWKSVDRLTSAAFVQMWRDRINSLYARYAEAGGTSAQQ